jgi:hypothetical protein
MAHVRRRRNQVQHGIAVEEHGLSQNDTTSTGITGQSSGRVMWWMPKTYQSTTSVSSIDRLAIVHRPMPVSLAD